MSNLPTNHNENRSLSHQFSDELLTPGIDLGMDYSEIFIDDLIDNPALKEIPLVKSVVGVIKGGIAVNQFFFAKKLLTFIQTFNSGQLDPEKKRKFQDRINTDDKYRKRVCEQVMIFVDRFIEINKAKISANVFKAYVEEKIAYEQLISLNIGLENLHPDSYLFIEKLSHQDYRVDENNPPADRDHDGEALLATSGLGARHSVWSAGFRVTPDGQMLCEFGIKPVIHP
ncbi:hypothetical protein [Mucilaginibacter ginsenosidivorax]|uniref:Uncharacterized protein n=1 Tax=Mucilaginibacter ginsenosidivorax TaxID=862126 RepID=A0A5B8W686_9SPHI|nr:hypothetical protein [Mucilaginibacter ginsenosidivorax]QEC78967.1 hypothetical protein FSB76_24575 [Mucilaginibacter ginsenosidivorax]